MLQFLKRYTKRTDGKRWTKKTILKRMAEECNVTPVNKKYDVWPLNEELDLYCDFYPYSHSMPGELILVNGFITPQDPKKSWTSDCSFVRIAVKTTGYNSLSPLGIMRDQAFEGSRLQRECQEVYKPIIEYCQKAQKEEDISFEKLVDHVNEYRKNLKHKKSWWFLR